jgi:hypothetical protein
MRVYKALCLNAQSAMFAAIEIHNKPVFEYRYEVCTILVINAWELALKAYIAKKMKTVKLILKDGTTKPFPDCLACVSSKLGKSFEPTKLNLEILYQYRNKISHFYQEDVGIVVLGLLKASVIFFSEFMETQFRQKLYDVANLILLPIGFKKPVSPIDYLSNTSASKNCSVEVKAFLESIKKNTSSTLEKQGFEDSIIVNYSIGLFNETRIKNADLTASINNSVPNGNAIAVYNLISAANLTNDPSAKRLRLSEDSIFNDIFTESYYDVVATAKERFKDFVMNKQFYETMRELKKNSNIARTRLLNPRNPEGGRQIFYSRKIFDELTKHYTLRK